MDKKLYLEQVQSKVKREVGVKESKVEKKVIEIVKDLMSKGEPTTIKRLTQELNKTPNYSSYVRVLCNKSEHLEVVKVKGVCLVVTQ